VCTNVLASQPSCSSIHAPVETPSMSQGFAIFPQLQSYPLLSWKEILQGKHNVNRAVVDSLYAIILYHHQYNAPTKRLTSQRRLGRVLR
jgi:hypothetical protein